MPWAGIHRESFSLLHFLSISLIGKDLLFLKYFLGKAGLKLNNGMLVYDAAFGFAVINEELLGVNHNGFAFFDVTHEAAQEIRVQELSLQPLNRCSFVF